MPGQQSFAWFLPAPYGDQDPNARLSNRLMNRIDLVLMVLVVVCTVWNVLGLRQVRSVTLDEANAFFLRPSTIALWVAVGLSVAWLIGRFILTTETRFVLFYEAAILFVAVLMPLVTQEISGFSINRGPGELNLTALSCPGTPPEAGVPINRGDCTGFPIDAGDFGLAAADPAQHPDQALVPPDETATNTARWRDLSSGEYTTFLVIDSPQVTCDDGVPNLRSLEGEIAASCDGDRVILTVQHPDDARNLQIAIYEER